MWRVMKRVALLGSSGLVIGKRGLLRNLTRRRGLLPFRRDSGALRGAWSCERRVMRLLGRSETYVRRGEKRVQGVLASLATTEKPWERNV